MTVLAILTIILCSFSIFFHIGAFIDEGILLGFIASSPEILSIILCSLYLCGR